MTSLHDCAAVRGTHLEKTTEQTASDTWDCEDLEIEEPTKEARVRPPELGYEIGLLDLVSDTERKNVSQSLPGTSM